MAMMLIEIASMKSNIHDRQFQSGHEQTAAGPLELLMRLPMRRRDHQAHQALIGLARAWGLLSFETRELAASLGRERWLRVARELSAHTDPVARASIAIIAHDTADPGFGKLVGTLLSDEHQSVRKAADKAILRMTMVLLEHLPTTLLGDDLARIALTRKIKLSADPKVLELERCILLRAIADAAWSFATHRCRSPLLAALLVMDRIVATPMEREISSRMRRLLSERNHPSHSPLRTVLRRTPSPILRERAFRWLVLGPMNTAAIDRLGVAETLCEHEVVLTKSHLAIRPKRASAMSSIRVRLSHQQSREQLIAKEGIIQSETGFLPARADLSKLSVESRNGVIRYAQLVSIEDSMKRDLLEPMLADQSSALRLSNAQFASMIDLPDYLFDIDENIARSSAIKWSSVGLLPPTMGSASWKHRSNTARLNARSPHAWVRRIAQEEAQRLSPFDPSSPSSRVQARKMYSSDPSGFVRLVRDQFANSDQCCNALMMIRLMGLESRFELDLIALMQSEELSPQIKATAVIAMGKVESNAIKYVMSEAMGNEDPRVRSNTVEMIDATPERLLEIKSDPHHRVRATSIRRLINSCDSSESTVLRNAGESLLEMLHDSDPMHRLAGVWAAQRTLTGASRVQFGAAWKPLINQVENLASGDQEPRIRQRASRCIHRLGCDVHLFQRRAANSIDRESMMDSLQSDPQADSNIGW